MNADELLGALSTLLADFEKGVTALKSEQEIRAHQASFLGKKGRVTLLMREMGKVPGDRKRDVGAEFNRVKTAIASAVDAKLAAIDEAALAEDLKRTVDVTLPGRGRRQGHVHLMTQIWEESVGIFAELGFEVAVGPQVDTDFHCFEALAIPKDHPARDDQDTYYIEGSDDLVLRPHTSPVQIRTMLSQKPPVRIVAPGIVYRRDDDATHSPMFTQIEGLYVDEGVRFSDLKGVLMHFVRRYFRRDLKIRFRPSYFPFVEPGGEVDMQCVFCIDSKAPCRVCKGTQWVEIGGAGMVDPDVFAHVKYDPQKVTGFAFGMGLERMAMLRHNVSDIKNYYTGDLRFLSQF